MPVTSNDGTEIFYKDWGWGKPIGLDGRLLFHHEVERAAAAGTVTGVLLIDINDLGTINEAVGSHAADALLRAVGDRLAKCVEGAATVAHLGADGFCIVIKCASDAAEIDRLVDHIMTQFAQPFIALGRTLTVQLSMGVAFAEADRLGQAGAALCSAKSTGRGRWRPCEAALHRGNLYQTQLRAELENAIAADQLVLHYQPIIELDTGRAHGLEPGPLATPQQRSPTSGDVHQHCRGVRTHRPAGGWVLEHSIREAVTWQREFPDYPPHVSINVSARQFHCPGFVDHVLSLIDRFGLPPYLLTLEITESVLLAEAEQVRRRLSTLRNKGIRISIDDFGTGYSSLSYLYQIPADILKLDKSFVDSMSLSGRQYDLVQGIVQLARTLKLDIVAEGIETSTHHSLLSATGCRFGQGYLISRPMPAPDTISWLTTNLTTSITE